MWLLSEQYCTMSSVRRKGLCPDVLGIPLPLSLNFVDIATWFDFRVRMQLRFYGCIIKLFESKITYERFHIIVAYFIGLVRVVVQLRSCSIYVGSPSGGAKIAGEGIESLLQRWVRERTKSVNPWSLL